MCFRHSDGRAIATQVANVQSKIGEQFCDSALIDSAECIELIYARRKLAVFNVRNPSMGQIIFPAMLVLRDLLAFLFDIAGGKSKADAQFFQPRSEEHTSELQSHLKLVCR